MLVVSQALRRLFSLQSDLTRKIIHIGAGMWFFGVLVLFEHSILGVPLVAAGVAALCLTLAKSLLSETIYLSSP